MKKILCLFLFVALSQAIHAWIVKTGATTKTYSVKAANMTTDIAYADSTSSSTSAVMWTYKHIVDVMGGACEVYRFNNVQPQPPLSTSTVTGFFVGTILENGKRLSRGLSIGAANRYDRIITKVTIDFVALNNNPESHPIIKEHLGHTTYYTYESSDCIKGRATIEPYLPVSIIPVVCEEEKLHTGNPIYKAYKTPAGGCLITDIKVEFVESAIDRPIYLTSERPTNRTTDYHISLGKEVKAVQQNGDYLSQRAILMWRKNDVHRKHYAKTIASDINADGKVNSADVTSVYKAIDSGDGEIEGIRYVDLGLPSGNLWATMNYGAIVPEDFGDFYAYNSTMGFLSHNIAKFTNDNYFNIHKWYVPFPWRAPDEEDACELIDNCTATKTYINDVYCLVLTSNINGNKLILPWAAGSVDENGYHDGDYAQYWTRTHPVNDANKRKTIKIYPYGSSNDIDINGIMEHYHGCYLRLVWPKLR